MSDLALPEKFQKLAVKLNTSVAKVIGAETIQGFEKAYLVATAAEELKLALTPEYMKPILALQNNRLGFKTDKEGGYPEATVKNCLIEAVLMGVQPFGNQFNIISGNSYITKEGFGYLLKNVPGLRYEIIPALPRINQAKDGAACTMKIKWSLNNNPWEERDIEFPIKMNQYMGVDAVIGKATRKARAWLYNSINGVEIPEGDASDSTSDAQVNVKKAEHKDKIGRAVGENVDFVESKVREGLADKIASTTGIMDLDELFEASGEVNEEERKLFEVKRKELAKKLSEK